MVRGIIQSLEPETLALTEQVCRLKYEDNLSVAEISNKLEKLGKNVSTSKIAYMLKLDTEQKIRDFKELSKDSKDRAKALIIIVQFLREKRNYTYSRITKELGISKSALLKVLGTSLTKDKKVKKNRKTVSEGRIEEYIRLNAEGKSLAEIAEIYNVSRQAVSALFKKMGYIPKTGAEITKMKIEKHAPELIQNISKDYIASIKKLKEEKRAIAQNLAVHKFWATQKLCTLRSDLIQMYIEGDVGSYSTETTKLFLTHYNTLMKYVTQVKENVEGEPSEVVIRAMDLLKKAEPYYNAAKHS